MGNAQSWSRICSSAFSKPLSQLLAINWGMAGFVIVSLLLTAAASLWQFTCWFRVQHEQRKAMWWLYGIFTSFCCLGSLCGAISFFANAQVLAYFFKAYNSDRSITMSEQMTLLAASDYWASVYYLFYAVDFFLLSTAKLLVLNRMLEFSLRTMTDSSATLGHTRASLISKAVMAVVAFINSIGVIGSVVTTVMNTQAADLYSSSAAAFASGQNVTGQAYLQQASLKNDQANQTASVQQFCEVLALVIIIISFTAAGFFCYLRLRTMANRILSFPQAANQGQFLVSFQRLKRRIFGTVLAVFVAFLLRSVFAVMNAVAASGTNRGSDPSCGLCDGTCQSISVLMYVWLGYTPEFQLSVVFVSSPLAILIALWGMSDNHKLKKLHSTSLLSSASNSLHLAK